jgi:hypothetical protein
MRKSPFLNILIGRYYAEMAQKYHHQSNKAVEHDEEFAFELFEVARIYERLAFIYLTQF